VKSFISTHLILILTFTRNRKGNETSAVLVRSSIFTNQSFDLVVTASGKMRTADYTTVRVRFVVLVMVLSASTCFLLLYTHSTFRNSQSAFYPWPVVERYYTNW